IPVIANVTSAVAPTIAKPIIDQYDSIPIYDSSDDNNTVKKFTWQNLKDNLASIFAKLSGAIFTGPVSFTVVNDGQFENCGLTVLDLGTVATTKTIIFDQSKASIQKFKCTVSNIAIGFSFTGWQSLGSRSFIEVRASNLNSNIVTPIGVKWKMKNGTYTSTFSDYLTNWGKSTNTAGDVEFLFYSDGDGIVYGIMYN
ncbi:MAG: hypothetical protein EBQ77_00170, partial [Sphingobacteriia bacterium]|nr:hypothetical protein [Sphingobacteriia bacterium]